MDVLRSPEAMMAWSDVRRRSQRIGVVPTMGFLHAGHTGLMDTLRTRVDALVVSIYVNPLQFGEGEDLDVYPQDIEGDLAKCRAHGVDAVFLPDAMYPSDFSTRVSTSDITAGLCGASRPGHFDGVTTVVARLFGLTRCEEAIFGEKDYQQLAVVRRMVRDLGMPLEVVGGAIVRDTDGLALSSRNVYLNADDRRRGLTLSGALRRMQDGFEAGTIDVPTLLAHGRDVLEVDAIDYLSIVDADTLEPLESVDRPARALVAARVGRTRLIDNAPLGG